MPAAGPVKLCRREGKYKLPPKFQKSRVLFNLHRVPKDPTHVVLVEGFWSVFRLHALQVPVVGLMGWSISREQVELLLQRGVTFVTLLLDGDKAGYDARERLLPELANTSSSAPPCCRKARNPTLSTKLNSPRLSPTWPGFFLSS